MLKTLVNFFPINVLLSASLHCSIGIAIFFPPHWYVGVSCMSICVSGALSPTASQTTNPQSASHMLSSELRRGNWFSYWLCLTLCHQHPKQLCLCPACLKSLNETLLMAAVLTPWLNNGVATKNCWGGRTGGKRYYFVFSSEPNNIYHLDFIN